MSKNETKDQDKTLTLTDDEIVVDRTIGRRSALGTIGAVAATAAVVTVLGTPRIAEAKATDSDPNDAVGHGRTGRTDSDPNDRAGHGRAGYRRPIRTTDSDPNDAAGHGRTGRTDSDPNDAAGHGRH